MSDLSPRELLLQLRRARSLVKTASMLAKGGPSAQRAAAQGAVEIAQQALQQKLGLHREAARAADLAMHALAADMTGDTGALAWACKGLSQWHPVVREATVLREILQQPRPSPVAVQMRLERLASSAVAHDPGAAKALSQLLNRVRDVERMYRDADLVQNQVSALWAELRGLMADLSATGN